MVVALGDVQNIEFVTCKKLLDVLKFVR